MLSSEFNQLSKTGTDSGYKLPMKAIQKLVIATPNFNFFSQNAEKKKLGRNDRKIIFFIEI